MTQPHVLPADSAQSSEPATFDFYATFEFEPIELDLDAARGNYQSQWTHVAIALATLTKSSSQCRDIVEQLADVDDALEMISTGLPNTVKWLRDLADAVDSGAMRLFCGMCRFEKELEGIPAPSTHPRQNGRSGRPRRPSQASAGVSKQSRPAKTACRSKKASVRRV